MIQRNINKTNKITSYEISKKLKDIKFRAPHEDSYLNDELKAMYFPAYDLETILEALPYELKLQNNIEAWLQIIKIYHDSYQIQYIDNQENTLLEVDSLENESLADTAARLLILLVEKGMVNLINKK